MPILTVNILSSFIVMAFAVTEVSFEKAVADVRDGGGSRETSLFRKSAQPHHEQQANQIRVELWFYWEKRLQQAYSLLQQYYANRPELALTLKQSQQAWLTARDATMQAYKLCLTQSSPQQTEDGWFIANMNLMIIEMTETRCRILEDLLNTIRTCDL